MFLKNNNIEWPSSSKGLDSAGQKSYHAIISSKALLLRENFNLLIERGPQGPNGGDLHKCD